ncbi:hypothetical protein NEIFLAOT_02328 [Neisseria flavescens NRL30031/H210]|uniref:Uncharacterized protein n=1 Tax=Neisseria flavescens NRL30031/H210 TaxID=546264 RepID=C0EQT4_NEIFL|nr:hypothetical protein NEIFLAOT_02328 [Neisseria flavescens NRL30031/H210]
MLYRPSETRRKPTAKSNKNAQNELHFCDLISRIMLIWIYCFERYLTDY